MDRCGLDQQSHIAVNRNGGCCEQTKQKSAAVGNELHVIILGKLNPEKGTCQRSECVSFKSGFSWKKRLFSTPHGFGPMLHPTREDSSAVKLRCCCLVCDPLQSVALFTECLREIAVGLDHEYLETGCILLQVLRRLFLHLHD